MSPVPATRKPTDGAVDVALRDGSTLHVRPVVGDDAPAMRAFFEALSLESIGLRFFGVPNVEWATKWAVATDDAERYALVATAGPAHAIVAHGAYVRIDDERAEVAFVVADAWQGHGIATILLGQLAAAAQAHGITSFSADVLPANHRMIGVFRDSGFPVELRTRGDVIGVEFPTSLSEAALERFEQRERTAAVAAMRSFLRPSSVAVIGASRRRGTLGGEVVHNLLSAGFGGTVHPVNLRAQTVEGRRAHASIADVPGPVELAVVAVPAADVAAVARECGVAGVRALVVLSSGFADAGAAGARRQRDLLAICREAGMRLVGPNCLGVLNAARDVRLHATYAGAMPPPGRVGFLSQSSGLGVAMIEAAGRLGIGMSSFVSVGNKADISGNDLLQYWEEDPDTDVVLLYLESFGNPRRFARIARRVSRTKPIVAVKGGRSAAGARAAASRTGAFLSASEVTVDALFEQAGVVRVDTVHELFDVATLLGAQPAPAGSRVAIVSNAGGPGILCADACNAVGLDVVPLPARVRRRLGKLLPAEVSLANPLALPATASSEHFRQAIEVLIDAAVCDAIVTIFLPPPGSAGSEVARAIDAVAQPARRVTLASVVIGPPAPAPRLGEPHVPRFAFPEDAARALAHAVRYGRWRARPAGVVREPPGCRPDEAAAIIAAALAAGGGWLGPGEVASLLACYGLPLLPTRVVRSAAAAALAAAELDGPVALKAIASDLIHKSDVGAVRLDLRSGAQVRRAAREIRAAVTAAGRLLEGFAVQAMAEGGVELLVGVTQQPSFGPVIVCGVGGSTAEPIGDAAVRITPLTDVDAGEMVHSLGSSAPPEVLGGRNRRALQDVLLRLSALVEAHAEVAELDLNPLVASSDRIVVVDARVRLEAPPPRRPPSSLRG
ncbi:MAG TPA: GNAT family N-acetyltransferase [Solirubrobacteraceae bacterium]|nr:GNAT family N-acetyltransferase [Solirubrobacteraceae bacterium]